MRVVFAQYGQAQVPVAFYCGQEFQAGYCDPQTLEPWDPMLSDGLLVYEPELKNQMFYAYYPGEKEPFKAFTYDEMQWQTGDFDDELKVLYANTDQGFMAEVVQKSYSKKQVHHCQR